MSYLAGRWQRPSHHDADTPRAAPEEGVVDRLRGAAGRFGPRGSAAAVAGSVAMVFGRLSAGAHDRRTDGPLHELRPGGELLLTWDGHLDHRGRLAHDLAAAGAEVPADLDDLSDSAWVLAAYDRWGRDLFDHLAGEYALALWDSRRGLLLLARDPSGARSLFYRLGDDGVTWATTLDALLTAHPDTPREVDEEWIAGFLTGTYPAGRTPYRALRSVPSAHVVEITVSDSGLRHGVQRFWRPEELPDLRLGSDREYEERFRTVFLDAVREHLRIEGPAFLELSGGVDSSSIACAGDLLLRRGEIGASMLHTVSYVFDAARLADERRWIREVESATGRPAHHVVEDEHPLLHGFDAPVPQDAPSLLPIYRARYERVAELMAESGSRVLLTGIGGDHVGWSELVVPPQLGDLASQGRLIELLREARRWQPRLRTPYLQLLWQGGVRQGVPGLRRSQFGLVGRQVGWIADGFARRTGIASMIGGTGAESIAARRPSLRQHYELVRDATIRQISPTYLEAELLGAEMRHPFLDRRLTELCLSIPVEQHVRPGESRSLHRRALAGILPAAIARREDKGGPDQALIRGFAREWPRLAALFEGDGALVYQLGIVDPGRFWAALEAKRFGLVRETGPVERIVGLEVWLRNRWRGGERAEAPVRSYPSPSSARVVVSTSG